MGSRAGDSWRGCGISIRVLLAQRSAQIELRLTVHLDAVVQAVAGAKWGSRLAKKELPGFGILRSNGLRRSAGRAQNRRRNRRR